MTNIKQFSKEFDVLHSREDNPWGGGQCLPSSLFPGDLGLERALWSPGSSPGEQEVIGWGCTADLLRKNREQGHSADTELARRLGLAGRLCCVSGHMGRDRNTEAGFADVAPRQERLHVGPRN